MFILSSISISLEIWSVNHNSVYEHSESKVSDERSNNWPIIYEEQMYTRLLNLVDNHC